jgi:hypothetical protein
MPARPAAAKAPGSAQAEYGAVDHWSVILFYSMGFGAIAVGILLFAVLVAVWFYGQFIWSFTQWDLANVRLTPFKSLAQLIVVATFLGGTCVGLWCFSGAAWRNRKPGRASTSRRTAR